MSGAARRRAQTRGTRQPSQASPDEEGAASPSTQPLPTIEGGEASSGTQPARTPNASPRPATAPPPPPQDRVRDQAEPAPTPPSSIAPSMAPSIAPSIAPSEVAANLDLDAIDIEHERLRRLVLAQRKQKEIEILRAEFRGEEVNDPIEIERTTLPVRKRPASIGLYSGHPKHLKITPRKKFTGASLSEL